MFGVRPDGTQNDLYGTYRIVQPPAVLEFTWHHDPPEHAETIVRYDLAEPDGVTLLTVTHRGFTTAEDHDDHVRGWAVVLG